MLGSNLELTAYVIAYELLEEGIVFVKHQVIETNAASDKDLLDARNCLCLLDELHIFAVIDLDVLAGRGS